MAKVVCVVGPNGIGKTALAFHLSSLLPASLVNADSRQVYRGLNIISGKDLPYNARFVKEERLLQNSGGIYTIGYYTLGGVRLYLIDVVDVFYSFSVADFLRIAIPVIHHITAQGKLPIVVGGTGFYVKTLLDGVETAHVPIDRRLRFNLEPIPVEELATMLEKEDSDKYLGMNYSDRANPRRLVRAIEVARWRKKHSEERTIRRLQENRAELGEDVISSYLKEYECLMVGLCASPHVVRQRIEKRVGERIERGAFAEAKKLYERFEDVSHQVKTTHGYRELFEYYQGKIDRDTAVQKWARTEYQYAKRQMTWFKKEKRIHWFDISKSDFYAKADTMVLDWYKRGG